MEKLRVIDPHSYAQLIREPSRDPAVQYLHLCLFENQHADDGAAARLTAWKNFTSKQQKALSVSDAWENTVLRDHFRDLLKVGYADPTSTAEPTRVTPCQNTKASGEKLPPSANPTVMASDGSSIHPQLAAHGPGHEASEDGLARAKLDKYRARHVHVAEHTAPMLPKCLLPPDCQARLARFRAVRSLITNPPPHTVWANAAVQDFLSVPRYASWVTSHFAENCEHSSDSSEHQIFLCELLEEGLCKGDFDLCEEAASLLNSLTPQTTPHPNRKLGSRQAYSSRLLPHGAGSPKRGAFRWEINGEEYMWNRI